MSKTEVKQKQKNKSSLCSRLFTGCILFMFSYASIYYFLFYIARKENVVSASDPEFDGNDDVPDHVKDMPNFKGARWLRGDEAMAYMKKMQEKKDQPVPPHLANMDMADAIAKAMGQMGEEENQIQKPKVSKKKSEL